VRDAHPDIEGDGGDEEEAESEKCHHAAPPDRSALLRSGLRQRGSRLRFLTPYPQGFIRNS
jgi:hypothetical protein